MLTRREPRRVVGVVVAGAALAVASVVGVFVMGPALAARAHIDASTRVAAVGVDEQGFWFARIEVQNTGNLPWQAVFVSNPSVVCHWPPAVEVGSTLPVGNIPDRFEFVIETVAQDAVPERPEWVTFELQVISAEPWYLPAPKTRAWPNALSL